MSDSSHTFALFAHDIDTIIDRISSGAIHHAITYENEQLAHRLHKVLRIRPKEEMIIFGKKYSLEIILENIDKKYITFTVLKCNIIVPLQPTINLWLPLLEKAAIEQAMYSATVLGVHTVYLIPTTKGKRSALTPHELNRLSKIIIAASEQSKQLCAPRLKQVTSWKDIPHEGLFVVADIKGAHLSQCIKDLTNKPSYTFIVGPEGDFTLQEKQKFDALGLIKIKLGTTILRSEDAVIIGLGVLRSLLCS